MIVKCYHGGDGVAYSLPNIGVDESIGSTSWLTLTSLSMEPRDIVRSRWRSDCRCDLTKTAAISQRTMNWLKQTILDKNLDHYGNFLQVRNDGRPPGRVNEYTRKSVISR